MIPLTIIVDSLGGWLALAFILVFVLKAALAAIGGDIGIDSDVDTDIDVNTDGEVIRMEIMNKKYYIIVENINGIKKSDIKIDDIVDSKDKTMSAC